MKPRYAIIDEIERNKFEKEFQLSYGYGDSYVTFDLNEAIEELEDYDTFTREFLSIERIDEYGREIVYRG